MIGKILKGLSIICVLLSGCESTYYNAWEKVGVHKRDILVDRIEETQESQQDTQEQFKDALEQYRAVVNFDGGDLKKLYYKLNDEFEASEQEAAEIKKNIEAVEDVAEDLFDEWAEELTQIKNSTLRRDSENKLRITRSECTKLIKAMKRAEKTVYPVLDTLRDQVLYLKHNLNAKAISSLKSELAMVDQDVSRLIGAMQNSINEANKFIEKMQ
jgi:hypothetical protein